MDIATVLYYEYWKEGSKNMDEKNMQFANFNITFGENDSPMLEHFADVIFPAFTSDYEIKYT